MVLYAGAKMTKVQVNGLILRVPVVRVVFLSNGMNYNLLPLSKHEDQATDMTKPIANGLDPGISS